MALCLAYFLDSAQRYEEAKTCCRVAITIDPNNLLAQKLLNLFTEKTKYITGGQSEIK